MGNSLVQTIVKKSLISLLVSFLIFLTLLTTPAFAQAPLAPLTIPKYAPSQSLFIPPAMPITSVLPGGIDYYEIAKRQFPQQILPTGFPQTTVWGFGAINTPASFHYPSYTVEALVNRRVRVKWINGLTNPDGTFIPHLFSAYVDQTLHWANPPQQCADGTTRPDCEGTSGAPYLGPVPMVVHLHGSHVDPESDGFPEAWYLPAANNLPAGYATQGSDFSQIAGVPVEAGAAVFQYRNDQRATTLWFHDHSLGITRLNIYAGPAGFYFLRGGPTDLPAGVLPGGAYETAMVIQERSFLDDGSLNFASPNGDGDGDTMVVNGKTWPYLDVEPRRYRFRLLNASNNNSIELALATDNTPGDLNDSNFTPVADRLWVIGADGGFLPAPANVQQLPLHIAERADVIIDFTGLAPGTIIYLINNQGDPGTTEQVMRFVVGSPGPADTSTPPDQLTLPPFTPLTPADATFTRQVSLNEGVGGPGKLLGTVNPGPPAVGIPLRWEDAITENPQLNAIEIWEIFNFEGGDHPIHIHMVQFQILDRTPIGDAIGGGTTVPPFPWETGTKDTVFIDGNTVTRVIARFDIAGRFVWHCHILDHEDDEMMRPYEVLSTTISFGLPGDNPLAGDWDGNGLATIGVYRPSDLTFNLRNSNTNDIGAVPAFVYGIPGDIPVAGNWDGLGVDTIGVYRPSNQRFYLRNSNTTGVADVVAQYGIFGDIPVAGDWDGNGTTTIGVYRPSNQRFYLRNSNTTGVADAVAQYGIPGDIPIAGDWDGNGTTTIGVYRPSNQRFYLRNSNTTGVADVAIQFGAAGDIPIVGDWDGNGTTNIGVYRPSDQTFLLGL